VFRDEEPMAVRSSVGPSVVRSSMDASAGGFDSAATVPEPQGAKPCAKGRELCRGFVLMPGLIGQSRGHDGY
jgi:hypothetical protein